MDTAIKSRYDGKNSRSRIVNRGLTTVSKNRGFIKTKFIIVAILFFASGFLLRPFYERYTHPAPTPPAIDLSSRGSQDRLGGSHYAFIDPLLGCEITDKKEIIEFQPLNDLIQKNVQTEINGKNASKISVYYRGMTSGRWAGFQENEIYPSGSLVKIPFLMAYLQKAQTNPAILDEKITYAGDFDQSAGQRISPAKKIEAGKSYSISELIYRMIVYSGNNSTVLLMRRLDRNYLNTVFEELNVPKDQDVNRQWLVTTKNFSYFFRILYNATYLNRTMSERALKTLSEVDFKDGIIAGVPKKIKVAHKFGEHTQQYSDGTILSSDLHDCGIIYHPKHPYLLCVMTEGTSQEALKGVIARISKGIYEFVDSHLYPAIKTS